MTTFNSKQTYLAALTEWKQRYNKLSMDQRARKAAIAQGLKEGKPVYSLQWDAISHKKTAQEQYLASKR